MNITVSFDQASNALPTGFVADVAAVVAYLENVLTADINLVLHVGYGEVNGVALAANSLGQSSFDSDSFTYAQIRAALAANATSQTEISASSSLPATDPVGGSTAYWVSQTEQQALGLLSPSVAVDGYVGFSSIFPFEYDRKTGIPSGEYDFIGAVAHEITEVMGREIGVGEHDINSSSTYYLSDLFHFSGSNVRDFSRGGYISADNGNAVIGNLNPNLNGDAGDLLGDSLGNAFVAHSNPGVYNDVTASDLEWMDILGYHYNGNGYAADTNFAGELSVGGVNSGSIISSGQQEWFRVFLNANTRYRIEQSGSFSGRGSLSNPALSVYDQSSHLMAIDQGSQSGGSGPDDSTLFFTPASTGYYYVAAGAIASSTGTFTISLAQSVVPAPLDFDGSGGSEVLWRAATGTLTLWQMNGSSVDASQTPSYQNSAIVPDSSWSIAGFGDFDGDGKTDIFWQQAATGALAMWRMAGSAIASSTAPGFQGTTVAPDPSWSVAGIADFDGDGKADLLWRHGTTGALAMWRMAGSTISSSASPTFHGSAVAPDSSWSLAGLADFNGDGAADVIWRQAGTGALAMWLMSGSTISSSAALTFQGNAVVPDSSWSVAGIGDFNSDGEADILWRQASTGSLAMWLMDGSTIRSSAALTVQGSTVTPDSSWNIIEIGDFNGDGGSDILWQQPGSGALAVWRMNGAQITFSDDLTAQGSIVAAPTDWRAQDQINVFGR